MSIDAVFAQFFDDIPDPRQHAKIYYPFYDVLFLTVCAVIGGADGWEDIGKKCPSPRKGQILQALLRNVKINVPFFIGFYRIDDLSVGVTNQAF
jgi:hypothetical protein